MGQPQVVSTAMMMCSFGIAPSTLNVLPINRVMVEGRPAANIMDHQPILNIPPFGMCTSLANPTVASATAAALGVLTPMPCIPVTPAPWTPGAPMTLIANQPAVTPSSQCMCAWGGVIAIQMPGSMQTLVS
ncbi:MAG: hypothetical protein QOC82_1016 [Frankiaceae bacterium]|jgi:hypothetical protein|nr:hypothetical protein [Frankiaceae bacterium]MDQ1699388.1 hypothetical protein [Frankiaceae bacterium]